jgi:hypothetical protein
LNRRFVDRAAAAACGATDETQICTDGTRSAFHRCQSVAQTISARHVAFLCLYIRVGDRCSPTIENAFSVADITGPSETHAMSELGEVRCQCGKTVQYKPSKVGKVIVCAVCGRSMTLTVPIATPVTQATPILNPEPPAPLTEQQWRAAYAQEPGSSSLKSIGRNGCAISAILAAVGCFFMSFVISSYYFAESSLHRFHTDNATGATANAVEHLAEKHLWPSGGHFLICSVLFVIVAVLVNISAQLQRR